MRIDNRKSGINGFKIVFWILFFSRGHFGVRHHSVDKFQSHVRKKLLHQIRADTLAYRLAETAYMQTSRALYEKSRQSPEVLLEAKAPEF